jgi:hypothetical protein
MRTRLLAFAATVVAAGIAVASALAAGSSVVYTETVAKGKPLALSLTTRRAASFHVLLQVRTQGRTRLFLSGKHAPKGGALIDTKTSSCEGAAGSFYCEGSYEPLPAGTYTWKIQRVSGPKETITLTLKW